MINSNRIEPMFVSGFIILNLMWTLKRSSGKNRNVLSDRKMWY